MTHGPSNVMLIPYILMFQTASSKTERFSTEMRQEFLVFNLNANFHLLLSFPSTSHRPECALKVSLANTTRVIDTVTCAAGC